MERRPVNKHQIVGCHWTDRSTGETLFVTQKSEARGWFNYYVADPRTDDPGSLRGMIHREGLQRFYARIE